MRAIMSHFEPRDRLRVGDADQARMSDTVIIMGYHGRREGANVSRLIQDAITLASQG